MSQWEQRLTKLSKTLERLGVRPSGPFRLPETLQEALTHSSASAESKQGRHNERLEMLGDSIVGFLVAEMLFELMPEAREGVMSRARATLVDESSLARQARVLGLGELLALGRGAELTGDRERPSVLADAFEALCAALYRSEGLELVRRLVVTLFRAEAEQLGSSPAPRDHKTLLQVKTQALWQALPSYRIVSAEGPEHARAFVAEVVLGDKLYGRGSGASKKAAEQDAAREALSKLGE